MGNWTLLYMKLEHAELILGAREFNVFWLDLEKIAGVAIPPYATVIVELDKTTKDETIKAIKD